MIIFDCDGVLVDSEILSCGTDARMMSEAGFPITQEDLFQNYIGWPKPKIFDAVAERRGAPWPDDLLARAEAVLYERIPNELLPVDGVAEFLAALDVPFAVASSSSVHKLRLSLDTCDLTRFFDGHIYSAEQVARGKPAPDVFLLAASQIGSDPADTLVIEDSPAGITAARRAGMRAIGFAGGSHCLPSHADRLMAAGAVTVVHHMRDLPAALAELGVGG